VGVAGMETVKNPEMKVPVGLHEEWSFKLTILLYMKIERDVQVFIKF
jgi:hypothetical protein